MVKHFHIPFLELVQQLPLLLVHSATKILQMKGAVGTPASRTPSARTFLVKCCLLAAALRPDTFPARWRPLSLIWDVEADATASPRGRRVESPFRETPPLAPSGRRSLPSPTGLVDPQSLPSFSRERLGAGGGFAWVRGPCPDPRRARQLELDWEGGKRKLSVPGEEDASKGIRGHFHFSGAAQLCLSQDRAGERLAGPLGSRTFAIFAYTDHKLSLLALPGARGGGGGDCLARWRERRSPGEVGSWCPRAEPASAAAARPGLRRRPSLPEGLWGRAVAGSSCEGEIFGPHTRNRGPRERGK